MIKDFACIETEKVFHCTFSRKLPQAMQQRALLKLEMLHAAMELYDLRVPPSNNLESLRGKRKGQYSIRINDQWRICFVWEAGDAYQVEIVDYH